MSSWRNTKEYRTWRAKVIRRDSRCVICSTLKGRQAHHIDHAMYYPDSRFDPDNGATMCGTCHSKYHNDYHNSTREKCTHKDFSNFKALVEYIKGLCK